MRLSVGQRARGGGHSPCLHSPGRLDGPTYSLHHAGPYHITLRTSWPPGLRDWQARPPH